MSEPSIICLGEILFDYLADQVGSSLEEVTSWSPYPGGAIANVACALVKLGTASAYIGCIGSDDNGTQLLKLLTETGVNSTGVVHHPTAVTRRVYVLREPDGDRTFAGFGDYPPDAFADTYLTPENLPSELFIGANFLVLGTIGLAYPHTRQAIWRALELADYYNLKVVLDVNWRPVFWQKPEEAKPLITQLLKSIDFLKLSGAEAEWLFNTKDAGAIAHRLDPVEGVLVTDGALAVSYCLRDNEGKITPPEFPVVDTTGAGDSFVAGFIHQLQKRGISSLDDPDTARAIVTYACVVGGLTTTKLGAIAAQPTGAEVEANLERINLQLDQKQNDKNS
ncbi:carbohydrate kinase [Gloeocapsa sp. PCC 73106]|uniref:carbohydrate kinase family protein n=1 Tax=Gloeocapsa sp. PCC 73106 TaxID=102232 RepID=UPI0002ACDC8A|nr:carbohydrate kinase [Gloeocapsa sp. PCC 73106]ELR96699.1 sugar kinase, ribokinase [Gloeocapsa sp. PCC 73106]